MNTFLFNGCSLTAGIEVLGVDAQVPIETTRLHTWAKKLSDMLDPNAEFVNIARNGASNDSIMRETLEWLGNHPEKHNENTVVFIMWTEPNRIEVQLKDNERSYLDVISRSSYDRSHEERHFRDMYNLYIANRDLNCMKTYQQMLSMEGILRMLGVRFVYLNAFNFSHFYAYHLRENSPFYKLSKYPAVEALFNDEYCIYNVCKAAGLDHTKFMHFFEDGHKYFAQYVYNKLEESQCLIH